MPTELHGGSSLSKKIVYYQDSEPPYIEWYTMQAGTTSCFLTLFYLGWIPVASCALKQFLLSRNPINTCELQLHSYAKYI